MRPKAVSVVEGSWGRSIVYSTEEQTDSPDPEQEHVQGLNKSKDTLRSGQLSAISKLTSLDFDASMLELGDPMHVTIYNDDPDTCRLEQVQAALFAVILEDTITQLFILDSCNTEMRIARTLDDMERLLNLKFGVETAMDAPKDELEGVDRHNMHSDKFKLIKLQRDRDTLSQLMKNTYEDLVLNSSFYELQRALHDLIVEREVGACIRQEEMLRRIKRRELARQLRQQRVLNQSQTAETETAINELKNAIEDAALNGEIRVRYVSRWQNSRAEQHNWTIHAAESVPGDHMDAMKTASYNEARVHAELESAIYSDIEETLAKIEWWMEKYDREMEKIDLHIQLMKNDYQTALDRSVYLHETMDQHGKAMVAWKSFKDEREKDRQYREMMHRSAVSVQSWWRGLLVRGQLGPYRPPKKGKAKPKK